MVKFSHKGDYSKATNYFKRILEVAKLSKLDKYGRKGVEALRSATPVDSGKTADSWDYEISHSGGGIAIYWKNSNVNKGVNIAIILQYGHGTGTGGYVAGRDYINPAIQPIFDEIANELEREMRQA